MKNKAVLIGFSGHAAVVAEAAMLSGWQIVGYAEKKSEEKAYFNVPYLGYERDPGFEFWNDKYSYILGVGDNAIRARIAELVKTKGLYCATIMHPDASISDMIRIGTGCFIARNTAINPLCVIGDNVIINTSASIDHECEIGNNSHIGPGAVLAGNVKIGHNAFIGANAVVKQGIRIGNNAIVGAGSVVLKNIVENQKVVGNPARLIT